MDKERYQPDGTKLEMHSSIEHLATGYEQDAQRIISCSSFRRLQGKTQVYPFPNSDYSRTRLTHTLEVAHAAHVIGGLVGKIVREKQPELFHEAEKSHLKVPDFSDVCAAAAYAHDIGNPPFGHIGEYAVQSWFCKKYDTKGVHPKTFERESANDFLCFDGNAEGFRLMNRLQGWRNSGGLRLSSAVIGAFTKYPWPSEYASESKKYGFAFQDREIAKKVFRDRLRLIEPDPSQPLKFSKHPLAYATEAADDISYLTSDMEDGVRASLLDFGDVEAIFLAISKGRIHAPRYDEVMNNETDDKLRYLRSSAASSLISSVAVAFSENYKSILAGTFEGTLIENTEHRESCNKIRKLSEEYIYYAREKIEMEAAGYNVIFGLLDVFSGMLEELFEKKSWEKLKKSDKNLFRLLPGQFRDRLNPNEPYSCYLVLVDYVVGMTDRYALELFQKLSGHSITIGRML